jgi:CRP-like cAMP-binding protein
MTDTSDGDALNRTILVRGFEGDERDLLRAVQDYGKVEDMKIRPRHEEVPRPRFDVGDFIGQESKFARGTNRITSGLKWNNAGPREVQGEELTCATLSDALTHKTEFEKHEWDAFGICDPLQIDTYIKSGDSYFRPAGISHTPNSTVCKHKNSLVWTSDMQGQTRENFPPVDPRAKEKALHCCESILLENLSSEHRTKLAEHCYVLRVLPEQELLVQDDDINFVFILVSGILRIFSKFPVEMRGAEGLYEDEIIVGAVSGTGQMLGEIDLFRKIRDPSHRHTISVSADVHSVVIAVPTKAILEMHEAGGWSKEFAAERVEALEIEREDLSSKLITSKFTNMSNFTQVARLVEQVRACSQDIHECH